MFVLKIQQQGSSLQIPLQNQNKPKIVLNTEKSQINPSFPQTNYQNQQIYSRNSHQNQSYLVNNSSNNNNYNNKPSSPVKGPLYKDTLSRRNAIKLSNNSEKYAAFTSISEPISRNTVSSSRNITSNSQTSNNIQKLFMNSSEMSCVNTKLKVYESVVVKDQQQQQNIIKSNNSNNTIKKFVDNNNKLKEINVSSRSARTINSAKQQNQPTFLDDSPQSHPQPPARTKTLRSSLNKQTFNQVNDLITYKTYNLAKHEMQQAFY